MSSNIKILAWNINGGLENKLNCESFLNYLRTYDVIFLSECWISNDFNFTSEGYVCKAIPRSKSKGIQGGGLYVMIKESYSRHISVCEVVADTFVWIKFHGELFNFNEDLYMCGAYLPPANSKYHTLYDCEIFRLLEENITSYSRKGKICLVGDLNCRTANIPDFIENDSVHNSLQNQLSNIFEYSVDENMTERNNPDIELNDYGSKLIKLCKSTGLLNGRHSGGYSKDFTYCGPKSLSVLDYFLISYDLFKLIDKFIVTNFNQFSAFM